MQKSFNYTTTTIHFLHQLKEWGIVEKDRCRVVLRLPSTKRITDQTWESKIARESFNDIENSDLFDGYCCWQWRYYHL